MECKRDFNQIVLPIFYDVDPSHVRAQLGSYSEAFAKHEDRVKEGMGRVNIMECWMALKHIVLPIFYNVDPYQDRVKERRLSRERVESWRAALTEAANLSGYHLQNGDEATVINIIVKDIDTLNRFDGLYSDVADKPVGIDYRVQELKELLNLGSDDVCIVAVWGVGGIGKTTIAKAVFNCIRNEFEGSSFLADVRDTAKDSFGVVKLQEQLLSNILMNKTYNLDHYHQGIEVIKQKIRHRRVLLVLDDVDDVDQLKKLAINRDFFHPGSRIIITTRNMTSIASLQVNSVHSPKGLNEYESLKLFSWNAFNKGYPEEEYRHMSEEIVAYAEGLPLILEVLGSFLSSRSTAEWQSDLDKLKAIPNGHIQKKLKISYDSLDDKNKELFLDIAFFFIGRDKDFTVKVLEDSGCFPEIGIGELARRCLVRVEGCGNKVLRMHDVLRDMGREIVRQQSLKEPGERSRLWYKEEVLQVLKDCTGTRAIEGLSLELPASNNEHVNTKAFENMSKLRLLHLNYLQCLSGSYITTLRNLKWLCWHGFPLACIPTALKMENLVAIDLQYSQLKQIWKGPKRLDKLRFLNLSHSYHLTKTPNFSGLKNLEMLLLNDCTRLVKVHNSIGCLDKLLMLNMANCINLSKVPLSLFMLKSLEKLDFSGCSKLREFAECKVPISMAFVYGLSCLGELNLANCNIEHIPSEIGHLITLRNVNLSGNKFCRFPSSFSQLSNLDSLYLDDCLRLKSFAHLPNNVWLLSANSCISLETVSNVFSGMSRNLDLELRNCPKLDSRSVYNNLKRSILRVPQVGYSLMYSGGELPNDIQFQSIDTDRLSFVVPPLVGKKIIGVIAYAAIYEDDLYIPNFEIVNKTKSNSIPTMRWEVFLYFYTEQGGDNVWITYEPIRESGFTLEGGDVAELTLKFLSLRSRSKRLGLSLIYGMVNRYEIKH